MCLLFLQKIEIVKINCIRTNCNSIEMCVFVQLVKRYVLDNIKTMDHKNSNVYIQYIVCERETERKRRS